MSWIESEHFEVKCSHCENTQDECAEFIQALQTDLIESHMQKYK